MKKFGEISMIQFAVSSDSTCDLYKDYIEKREIWFAPLTFTLEKNGNRKRASTRFPAIRITSTSIRKFGRVLSPVLPCSIMSPIANISAEWPARVSRTFCISAFPRDSRAPFPSSNRRRRK